MKIRSLIRLYNKIDFRRFVGMRILFLVVHLTFSFSVLAQLKIGSWKSHLPMSDFKMIDQMGSKIFAVNQYGMLVYDKTDESVVALSKLNDLSQTGISAFKCSDELGLCIVGYEDGNLDFINDQNSVINQPAVSNSSIVGDKVVNQIIFEDQTALLLTGIGVVKIDLFTFNILEYGSLLMNDELMDINHGMIYSDHLFFSSSSGIFKQNMSSLFTVPDPKELSFDRNLDYVSQFFELDSDLYLLYTTPVENKDTLFKLVGDEFIALSSLENTEMRFIDVKDDKILVTNRDRVVLHNKNFEEEASIFTYSSEPGVDANMALFYSGTDSILVADGIYGGILTSFSDQYNSVLINISSPKRGNISELRVQNDILYGLPGGSSFSFNTPYIFSLTDYGWESRLLFYPSNNSSTNPIDIAVYDSKKYVVFDRSGMMILDKDYELLNFFDDQNNQIGDDVNDYYGIRGIEKDEEGNLWMLNSTNVSTLSLLDVEGKWQGISFPEYLKPIVYDLYRMSNGYLIFSLKESGIIIYDPNDTPSDLSDDRYKIIKANAVDGNLPNNNVNCFAEDRDGELWIGTDEGIGVIYNPSSVFEPNFEGVQRIIVNQDGYNGYLFETDAVVAIKVDGANRKWVAPNGAGLFLISADGTEELLSFSSSDSPLLSDIIYDLEIMPKTGELFIATENGLLSYQPDASEPEEALSTIKVFPNPVKPGYNGLITFTNLTGDASIRITDSAGNLIYETRSQGGTATWDGKTRSGEKVSSGVYLVFVASRDGIGGSVGKIMFLN